MKRLTSSPLAALTTLEVGGPARALWIAERTKDIDEALHEAPDAFVLGGGSNVVIADAGYDGVVLAMQTRGIELLADGDHCFYEVAAGEPWDHFVARTVNDGCAGLECLSGIPGTVGGTPIQNVGAYGREVSEAITQVRVVDRKTREEQSLRSDECAFSYRMSRFKREPGFVVTSVTFALPHRSQSLPILYKELATALGIREGETAPVERVRDTVIALRRSKGMVLDPNDADSRSVGSFFMNPIVDAATADKVDTIAGAPVPRYPQKNGSLKLAAGWLVERGGSVKGEACGGARISTKHALALTNTGTATASDVVTLARRVRDRVRDRFAITLEPEPVLVGVSL